MSLCVKDIIRISEYTGDRLKKTLLFQRKPGKKYRVAEIVDV